VSKSKSNQPNRFILALADILDFIDRRRNESPASTESLATEVDDRATDNNQSQKSGLNGATPLYNKSGCRARRNERKVVNGEQR